MIIVQHDALRTEKHNVHQLGQRLVSHSHIWVLGASGNGTCIGGRGAMTKSLIKRNNRKAPRTHDVGACK